MLGVIPMINSRTLIETDILLVFILASHKCPVTNFHQGFQMEYSALNFPGTLSIDVK